MKEQTNSDYLKFQSGILNKCIENHQNLNENSGSLLNMIEHD